MTKTSVSVQTGPPMLGLLFLVFMTLKLTGHISWSWFYVTAPLWGGFALITLIALTFVAAGLLSQLLEVINNLWKR